MRPPGLRLESTFGHCERHALLHMAPKWFDHWTTWAGLIACRCRHNNSHTVSTQWEQARLYHPTRRQHSLHSNRATRIAWAPACSRTRCKGLICFCFIFVLLVALMHCCYTLLLACGCSLLWELAHSSYLLIALRTERMDKKSWR